MGKVIDIRGGVHVILHLRFNVVDIFVSDSGACEEGDMVSKVMVPIFCVYDLRDLSQTLEEVTLRRIVLGRCIFLISGDETKYLNESTARSTVNIVVVHIPERC